ncbi:MAG: hypothetical protein ABW189_08630 [Rickettsiales bacterium]
MPWYSAVTFTPTSVFTAPHLLITPQTENANGSDSKKLWALQRQESLLTNGSLRLKSTSSGVVLNGTEACSTVVFVERNSQHPSFFGLCQLWVEYSSSSTRWLNQSGVREAKIETFFLRTPYLNRLGTAYLVFQFRQTKTDDPLSLHDSRSAALSVANAFLSQLRVNQDQILRTFTHCTNENAATLNADGIWSIIHLLVETARISRKRLLKNCHSLRSERSDCQNNLDIAKSKIATQTATIVALEEELAKQKAIIAALKLKTAKYEKGMPSDSLPSPPSSLFFSGKKRSLNNEEEDEEKPSSNKRLRQQQDEKTPPLSEEEEEYLSSDDEKEGGIKV